ncbi:hypothetical protein N9I76_00875, partial [Candidatus Thioglobus sp.]
IEFSSYVINPDYIFRELENKVGADIILEDDSVADTEVCLSDTGKTIKLVKYGYDPDFVIELSRYGFDFSIYNNSSLSIEEAISIFVIQAFHTNIEEQ